MKPAFVADVGNSRIKWGRCTDTGIADMAWLPPDDAAAWERQWNAWQGAEPAVWAVSGVQPRRARWLGEWLRGRAAQVQLLDDYKQLPLQILVVQPERVGMDRLLNAIAAKSRMERGRAAVIIDAGTAVTVDWVDDGGAFGGGAIFPGLQLMAKVLHDHTALLPLVEMPRDVPAVPGISTTLAIQAGVFWSAAGGIRALADRLATKSASGPPVLFLTGGDAVLVQQALGLDVQLWPEMTLEGIRLSAEALP